MESRCVEVQAAVARSQPDSPRLIFLHINVVQNLMTFGEFVCEGYLDAEPERKLGELGQRMFEDVCSLHSLMQLGRHYAWPPRPHT